MMFSFVTVSYTHLDVYKRQADIWTMTCDPACAPDEPTYVEIEFDQGVPCALDGTPMSFLDICLLYTSRCV